MCTVCNDNPLGIRNQVSECIAYWSHCNSCNGNIKPDNGMVWTQGSELPQDSYFETELD